MRTPLCERLGIDHPIIQAPIGGPAGPALASAVSGAGGLGTVTLTGWGADGTRRRISEVRARTDRPFACNLLLSYDIAAEFEAMLAERVPVVSLFWGDPAPLVGRIHDSGALLMMTVGSVAEAESAAEAGADIIVAQGWEAGGHVRGTVSTLALVPAVVDAVAPVPVAAAGGIGDGRGLAAVLALGAQAAFMGTRFLGATEAEIHPLYRTRVLAAEARDTVISTLYDGTWPDAPGRVLRTPTVAAWEDAGRPPSGNRPGEGDIVANRPKGPIRRYDAIVAHAEFTGDIEALPLWAGLGVGLVRREQPAADIVRDIVTEARAVLAAASRGDQLRAPESRQP
ncbi:nitronate monooxygenase family protein [Pararhodobacter sp. SW119]|uniref:NAD(P)H-dependent flavin oxidoreductase n=1 Tax=Pararhodobacter sp. SW119 TaxID=2780075 RepID=UPI001ADFB695|nr:nitronate monooxygenase family protein [Pararhodobacter sp. SW119]